MFSFSTSMYFTLSLVFQCSILVTLCKSQDVVDEFFFKLKADKALDVQHLENKTLTRFFEELITSDFDERTAQKFVKMTVESDSKRFEEVMVSCQHVVFSSFNATPLFISQVDEMTYEQLIHVRMLIQREFCFQLARSKANRQKIHRFLLWNKARQNDGLKFRGNENSKFYFAKRDSYLDLGFYLMICSKQIIDKLETPIAQEREYWENALDLMLVCHALGYNSSIEELFNDIKNPPNLRAGFEEIEASIRRRYYDWIGCPKTGRFVWLPFLGRVTRAMQSVALYLEGEDIEDSIRFFDSGVCPGIDANFSPSQATQSKTLLWRPLFLGRNPVAHESQTPDCNVRHPFCRTNGRGSLPRFDFRNTMR